MAPPETFRDFTFISSRNECLRTVLHALYIKLNRVHVATPLHITSQILGTKYKPLIMLF